MKDMQKILQLMNLKRVTLIWVWEHLCSLKITMNSNKDKNAHVSEIVIKCAVFITWKIKLNFIMN